MSELKNENPVPGEFFEEKGAEFEPKHAEEMAAVPASVVCKNCETEFTGHYCNNCGQSVKDFDRPFKVLIFDVVGTMWAFDTRLFKTLKAIFLKPGQVPLDYVHGKRARYMPPFRLYIFISFIFFMLMNISFKSSFNEADKQEGPGIENVITINGSANGEEIDPADVQKAEDAITSIKDNKNYYTSRFLSLMSWSLFILMPLFASFLWIMFRKYQRYFLGHFIFAINLHSFLFILFIIILTVNLIFPDKTSAYEAWLLMLYPVYIVSGSRKLYGARWKTIFMRTFFVQFIYLIVLTIAICILFYLTFRELF